MHTFISRLQSINSISYQIAFTIGRIIAVKLIFECGIIYSVLNHIKKVTVRIGPIADLHAGLSTSLLWVTAYVYNQSLMG